jgi:hypothetical protein
LSEPAPTPEPEPTPEAAVQGQHPVTTRIRQIIESIAPTTLATVLLVYFGYVATRSRFDYFGVPLDMTGLTNQELMLYGLEVVYVPAALVFLSVLTVIGVHTTVTWRLTTAPGSQANVFLAALIGLAGLLLVCRALIGMLVSGTTDTEAIPGTTAMALALGPATLTYGLWIFGKDRERSLVPQQLRGSAFACVVGLAVSGLFWASTEFAWAYGTGRGQEDAEKISSRAEIVLDTKEPLVGLPSGITQVSLPTTRKDPSFAYRYRGFRILLTSDNRLFLVSGTWKYGTGQTVVVPYNEAIRIQLIPHS